MRDTLRTIIMEPAQDETVQQSYSNSVSILTALPALQTNVEQLMHKLDPMHCGSSFSSLRTARSMRESLRQVLARADRIVGSLEEKVMPLSREQGIASIPAELFSSILELAATPDYEAKWPQDMSYMLSHVSHRFRGVAIRTPSLWAYMTSAEGRKLAPLRLERSGGAPIDVHIVRPDKEAENGKMDDAERAMILDMFLQHVHRWRSFYLDSGRHDTGFMKARGKRLGLQSAGKIKMPLLESLTLFHPDLIDEDIYHIYASWDMPTLKTLRTVNLIPRLGVFGASVTAVSYTYSSQNRQISRWNFKPLLDILLSLPNVHDFHLGLDDLLLAASSNASASLPSITSFTITSDAPFESPITSAMKSLRFPNITHLKAVFTHKNVGEQPEMWINALFPPCEVYGRLTDFELVLDSSNSEVRAVDPCKARLNKVFGCIPNLRNLTLQMPDISLSNPIFSVLEMKTLQQGGVDTRTYIEGMVENALSGRAISESKYKLPRQGQNQPFTFPALRSVHLRQCHKFRRHVLKDILEGVRENGDEEALERVEVEHCAQISRQEAELHIPAEKVVWTS